MDKIVVFFVPTLLYVALFMLNGFLPARQVIGYVAKTGTSEKMSYHLNGILVFFLSILLWFLLGYYDLISFDWLYRYRWYELSGAFTFGIIFSMAVVLPYPSVRKSFWSDFYLGRIENLQLLNGRIDAKMWLYLVGAIVLELNALSFSAHHWLVFGANASFGI